MSRDRDDSEDPGRIPEGAALVVAQPRVRSSIPTRDVNGELVNSWAAGDVRAGQGEYAPDAPGRRRCQSIGGDGWRCVQWAMLPTSHCRLHGALHERAMLLAERRYGEFLQTDERLLDRFCRFLSDPDISDVRPELALQRALLAEQLDGLRADELSQLSPNAIAAITQLNAVVAKLAEQCDAQQSRAPSSVTPSQLLWVVEQIVHSVYDAIREELPGDELAEVRGAIVDRIADALEAIAVPDRRGRVADGLVAR